jgi:putative FmdB family regulatory protein
MPVLGLEVEWDSSIRSAGRSSAFRPRDTGLVRRAMKEGASMPLYEFECAKCKTTFTEKETFEEHDRHPEVKCPKCGSTDVHGLLCAVGVKTSKKS